MEVIQVALSTAERIRAHFETPLNPEDVAALIEAAFWASLRREEGYVPKISIALVAPERVAQPLLFARPLSLDSTTLTKVAPAVERPGIRHRAQYAAALSQRSPHRPFLAAYRNHRADEENR